MTQEIGNRALTPHPPVCIAKPLKELKLDLINLDPDKIDCKAGIDYVDECGLQQGNSHRFEEFGYPTNQSFLTQTCKRQTDAFKCLHGYAKCLQPLPRQVLKAMITSRTKYNRKICERDPEAANRLMELSKCMNTNKAAHEKGLKAELNSILISEAIVKGKIENSQDRLRYSCCSVAKVRKEFMEATLPHCAQHSQTATEIIDSYLSDTVDLICPKNKNHNCDALAKLEVPSQPSFRYFIRPIINVIQTLS